MKIPFVEHPAPRLSRTVRARAADRHARAADADTELTLDEIGEDEATRQPVNARAAKRAVKVRRARAMKRARRIQARQLIAARAATPAPSRGAARLATRLIADLEDAA